VNAQNENEETSIVLGHKVLLLFLAGFLFVVAGAVILTETALFSSSSHGSFGVTVFIGPFPILIGGGPDAQWLILATIILAITSPVVFLLFRRENRRLETMI